MQIKEIRLRSFRKFNDLTVTGLSDAVKLVILAGPNGCGKSSLFDGFNVWRRQHGGLNAQWDDKYHLKQASKTLHNRDEAVHVVFHHDPGEQLETFQKAFHIRSAYRIDPEFVVNALAKAPPILMDSNLLRMIDNDAAVNKNYQRIASQAIQDVLGDGPSETTFDQYRNSILGDLRKAMENTFPDLTLHNLGNPLNDGTFKFAKGTSTNFLYLNLSGGEKSAFDLLLDFCVKRNEFNNTVFCIDEPESHINTRLQGPLLKELYALLPKNSQLWIATHSIGMMRAARDINDRDPGMVAFLDFEGIDFDNPQTITPTQPSRIFWERVLKIALDDLAELVAPSQVVICEGATSAQGARRNAHNDAKCYNIIFSSEFPETKFVSAGNSSEVETDRLGLMEALNAILVGTKVLRLIDGDDHSELDIAERRGNGIRVLSRRHLESYLFDDEVLKRLCEDFDVSHKFEQLALEKQSAIAQCVAQGKPTDDIKSAAGLIFSACNRTIGSFKGGNDASAFMRNILAPRLGPGMTVYEELKKRHL